MINRGDIRKQLQEGLNAVFGKEYGRHPEEWRDAFEVFRSEKAYEEDVKMTGTGAATVKPEGSAVQYDDIAESYVARYTHETVAIAVSITEEAIDDNLYGELGATAAQYMARSMLFTKEIKCANVFNYGFDTNYAGGDDQPLFSAAHPLSGGGTQSNILGTPADLAESSLEELLLIIADWTDDRGIPVKAQVRKLLIPTELQFVATRLLMTPYQPDTSDNNVNALFKLGSIRDGFSVNHYLTDPDAWFLLTDVPHGLKYFQRKAMKKGVLGDFDTDNMRYKVSERYAVGWSDPLGAAGSAGA